MPSNVNINYTFIQIQRAIMHQIIGKTAYNANTRCEYSEELLELDDVAKGILISRLSDALGLNSKSFKLDLANDGIDSTFSLMKNITSLDEQGFIDNSKDIATHLAMSSNRGGIPGGFLLFLDCQYNSRPLYILIKAEPHDALSIAHHQAQALKDIILSPSQKMYKVFCMIQNDSEQTKDSFTYLLFDEQFSSGVNLAKYFYKDFLGLTLSGNSALMTKMFYEKMLMLIRKNFLEDYSMRAHIEEELASILTNEEMLIVPSQIINSIIPLEHRDLFLNKICTDEFSQSFSKDLSQLRLVLAKKRVDICKGIKLSGDTEFFSSKVNIGEDPERPGIVIITVDTNE